MKPFYKSKTVWFNALTAMLVIATMFGYSPENQFADTLETALIAVSPLINLILRAWTKEAILVLPKSK